MSDEYQEYAEPINEEEEDGNTTTVQFIAVSADEHERMIREGELPATIQVYLGLVRWKFDVQVKLQKFRI